MNDNVAVLENEVLGEMSSAFDLINLRMKGKVRCKSDVDSQLQSSRTKGVSIFYQQETNIFLRKLSIGVLLFCRMNKQIQQSFSSQHLESRVLAKVKF